MIIGTLKGGTRDGKLVIVDRTRTRYALAEDVAPTLQQALDHWQIARPKLEKLGDNLNTNRITGSPIDIQKFHSPLPRAYGWVDGSAFLNHVILVRKARGAEPPATMKTDPLMYQGGSDSFLAPTEPIPLGNPDWGLDFESEVCVITDDVPQGCPAKDAERHIQLVVICNDVTLRNLIPDELAKGFGFFNSKPSSAFSPFALTLDELGTAWKDARVHLPLESTYNGKWFGSPNAGNPMHFSFAELIAHAAKTRPLAAGTIVGSGTVSEEDRSKGHSCLAEVRMIEKIETGEMKTPFMKVGDTINIEMKKDGVSLFGAISQKVAAYRYTP